MTEAGYILSSPIKFADVHCIHVAFRCVFCVEIAMYHCDDL